MININIIINIISIINTVINIISSNILWIENIFYWIFSWNQREIFWRLKNNLILTNLNSLNSDSLLYRTFVSDKSLLQCSNYIKSFIFFRQMKVTFIHPNLGIGGAERLILDAAIAMKINGHEVEIVTNHYREDHCFEESKQFC